MMGATQLLHPCCRCIPTSARKLLRCYRFRCDWLHDRYGLAFLAGKQYCGATLNETFKYYTTATLSLQSSLWRAHSCCHLSSKRKRRTMENAKMNSLIAQYPLVRIWLLLKKPPGLILARPHWLRFTLCWPDRTGCSGRPCALTRFAPYLAKAFPETAATGGILNQNWLPFRLCKNGWKRNIKTDQRATVTEKR